MRRLHYVLIAVFAMTALLIAACSTPEPQIVEKIVEKEVTVVVVEQVEVEGEMVEVTRVVEETITEEIEVTVVVEKQVVNDAMPIVYNSNQSDEIPRAFDEKVVAEWNEANPNMQVQHSTVNHEDFKQAIRAYLVAEPAPDVLTWFAGNRARFFIDKGLIMPISDVWENEGWNESYPKGFRALSEVDGEAYFLPISYYWWAVYYRPSIFAEVGLEVPTTWEEYLNSCDVLNEAGYIPITIGTKFRWTAAAWFDYLNMRTNGPQFHLDLMLGKESYTDDRVKETMMHWEELFDHNCFIEDPAAYSWQEAVDPLAQGEAAMYLMGQFIQDSFPDELQDDLDFFQFPMINDVPIGEDAPTDGFFLANSAANPEGAKAFLAHLGSAEVQQQAAEELGRLATNGNVDLSVYDDQTQKGIELINSADLVLQFYDRDTTPEMADIGMDGFMAFWDDPSQVDAVLEQLEAARLEIFADQ
ncbi:MAG: ABC transporter substrate-binding protein [Candidatus Promineifilaceae bacterium]